jgi:hypothetical protein
MLWRGESRGRGLQASLHSGKERSWRGLVDDRGERLAELLKALANHGERRAVRPMCGTTLTSA